VKRGPIILLIALIFAARLAAQEATADFTTPGTADVSSLISKDPQLQRDDVIVVKKFKVTGFLVRPFKAMRLHKAGSTVLSLFQAINPFSRGKGSTENPRFEGELSTVAWSSSVGWRAGDSGISNPVTHEIGLTALSVSR